MRSPFRTLAIAAAQVLWLCPALALADPFFSAGVAGVADANDSNVPCELPGEVSEGYETFPNDAFVAYAEGDATGFNPCSALSGSARSISSANLATGQLRVYALAQLGMQPYQQEARAYAFFSDDVTLFSGANQIAELPGGQVGEIRLDIHGSRSAELVSSDARLQVDAPNGSEIGDELAEDLQGTESLVVQFTGPFSFFASLGVIAADGQFADFGSTGTLSVTLPEGFTFGSTSGVLLAPEPGGCALLVVALTSIAALRQAATRLRFTTSETSKPRT